MANIRGCMLSTTCEWATPISFFNILNDEFHFTLDPCSTDANAKCKKHYTKEDNGLLHSWGGGESVCQSTLWQGDRPMGKEVV